MPLIINSSFEGTTVGQRFSFKADMDFLQSAIRNESAYLAETLIGETYDASKSYILKGCKVSSTGGTTTVTAGYIYGIPKTFYGQPFQRYIYYYPGGSFPDPSGGNVLLVNISQANSAFDPTPFLDVLSNTTTNNNVHKIITVTITTGGAGTGDWNFSDLIYYNQFTTSGIGFATGGSNAGTPYLDFAYKVKGSTIELCGTVNFSNVAGVGDKPIVGLPTIGANSNKIFLKPAYSTLTNTSAFFIQYGYINATMSAVGNGLVSFDGCSFRAF